MATQVTNNKGQVVTLENPAERASRYAKELKEGKNSKGEKLTPAQAGVRMGVLKERKTQARIFNKKRDAVAMSVYGIHYSELNSKQQSAVDKKLKK